MNASQQIDNMIDQLQDWRGERIAQLRKLINDTEPRLQENWKWNTAVWTLNGNVCALGAFKDFVKLNFFKGAALSDPSKLFNSGLDSKAHRSINFPNNSSKLPVEQLRALIKEAVAKDGGLG